MDRLRIYEEGQELLLCELEKLVKNQSITSNQLDFMDKIVDIIKDLDEVSMNEESRYDYEDGNSQRYMPRAYYTRGSSYRGGSDGSSYGSSYGRRSNMGRMYSDGISRNDGKADMLDHLYAAHDTATSEDEKKRIKRMIDEIEKG